MRRTVTFFLSLLLLMSACNTEGDSPESGTDISVQPEKSETQNQAIHASDVTKHPLFDSSPEGISNNRRSAITNAVEKASPAIVSITVTELQQGYSRTGDPFFSFFFERPVMREVQSMGSGFIISADGLVVTNQHVASQSAKTIMVVLSDGEQYEAELLGSDELADLSLIKIKGENKAFPYVKFADSESVMVGEWAIAMGNPFGLFADGQPSVTVGVVSATKRDFRPNPEEPRVYMDMIQTDASINRGNSGGPLLNSDGEVIGVNTFIYTGGTSNGFVGLGFAIPSDRVQKIIGQLEETGEVSLGFDPGMEFTPMTSQLVYQYGLPRLAGLLVMKVNKDGPAFEAGILPGDIITKIGEERVTSEMHAWALMREFQEGETMVMRLFRDGSEYEADLELRKSVTGN